MLEVEVFGNMIYTRLVVLIIIIIDAFIKHRASPGKTCSKVPQWFNRVNMVVSYYKRLNYIFSKIKHCLVHYCKIKMCK